jgi:hypothetical protein
MIKQNREKYLFISNSTAPTINKTATAATTPPIIGVLESSSLLFCKLTETEHRTNHQKHTIGIALRSCVKVGHKKMSHKYY